MREIMQTPMTGNYTGGPDLHDAIYSSAPSHSIYQIANGFVVVKRNEIPVYCKTGEDITEAIITGAVKEKMNITSISSSDQIKAGIQRVTRTY